MNYPGVDKAAMNQHSSYGEFQDIVRSRPGSGSAAEAHGLLVGLLCADAGIGPVVWLEALFGDEIPAPEEYGSEVLARLFDHTRRQLGEFDFAFDPLLPGDENPLSERALALAEWCQGFLAGLGYAAEGSDWPGECNEVLRDFVEISRLDPEGSGDTDETAYAELFEYVRVGALFIHSELQSGTPRQMH